MGATIFDQMEEGCFISAAQALEVMKEVQQVGRRDEFKWWHVVCSRVIDKWNLSEERHTQVACYYVRTPDLEPKTRISPFRCSLIPRSPPLCGQGCTRATMVRALRGVPLDVPEEIQNRALSQVGRGDHTEYSHSKRVAEFAAVLIARNLRSSTSGSEEDVCAVCLDTWADGSALWTCSTCRNCLHARCARAWVLKVEARARSNDDEDDEDEAVEALCPYCRAPACKGTFSVGINPRKQKSNAGPVDEKEIASAVEVS